MRAPDGIAVHEIDASGRVTRVNDASWRSSAGAATS
jgi:hypothetical protein